MLDPFIFNFYCIKFEAYYLLILGTSMFFYICYPHHAEGLKQSLRHEHGPSLCPACSKISRFPQTPWWRCGGLVILTAALFAGILRRLYSNGYHFGVGREVGITTPRHLPLGDDTMDFCERGGQRLRLVDRFFRYITDRGKSY